MSDTPSAPTLGRRALALAALGAGIAAATPTAEAALPTLDDSLDMPVKFIDNKGVKIAYVEKGSGGPPLLLVHGMLTSHKRMMHMLHHFSKNHRVIAVDLRGHGKSDAPKTEYTDQVLGGDLVAVCRALGVEKPIGIGTSFGGSTLLHLAYDQPDFLGGLILLDSGVRSSQEREAELGRVYDDPDPNALRKFLGERMYNPFDPPELREDSKNRVYPPEHVVEGYQQIVRTFDAAEAAAAVKLPSLFILATRPFTSHETIQRLGPNWLVGQVVASGHSLHLIVPEQVFPMIERFIKVRFQA